MDNILQNAAKEDNFASASTTKLDKQPLVQTVTSNGQLVLFEDELILYKSNDKVASLPIKGESIAVNPVNESQIAVGGDETVFLLQYSNNTLTLEHSLPIGAKVSALAFTPNGEQLVTGDVRGRVLLFDMQQKTLVHSNWVFHSAKINSVAWNEDGSLCASGGLDTNIYIWKGRRDKTGLLSKYNRSLMLADAHQDAVTGVAFIGRTCLISSGRDGCVKVWDLTQ